MNVLPESLWMETYLQTYLNDIYFLIITKELCIARSNATGTFLVFKYLKGYSTNMFEKTTRCLSSSCLDFLTIVAKTNDILS
jgi:hypothetical protein